MASADSQTRKLLAKKAASAQSERKFVSRPGTVYMPGGKEAFKERTQSAIDVNKRNQQAERNYGANLGKYLYKKNGK